MNEAVSTIKKQERCWQDRQGGTLQQEAYRRPGTRIMMEAQFDRVAAMLKLEPGMRVLDLGCGAGLFLGWLRTHAKISCHGLDLSLNSLKSAQVGAVDLKLILGDAESLPYKAHSFERISCNGAAHHLLDLGSAVHEMYRVLAPGGIAVMYEPNANVLTNLVRALFLNTDKYESPADLAHKDAFTPGSVRTILQDTGFTDIRIGFYDFLAYPLSGMYIDLPFSRSRTAMKLLIRLESALQRLSFLKLIFNLFAWRLVVVASKPLSVKSLS